MRKMKEVRRFARWCFSMLDVPPCKIVFEPCDVMCDETGDFYGVYVWDEEKDEPGEIHVSGRMPKMLLMGVLAHEIVHHDQHTRHCLQALDAEERESQARDGARTLLQRWLERGGYTVQWRD